MVPTIRHTSTMWPHHPFITHPWFIQVHQAAAFGKVLCNSRLPFQGTKELPLVHHLTGVHILHLHPEVHIQIHLASVGSDTLIPAKGAAIWLTDQYAAHTQFMGRVEAKTTTEAQA